MERRPLRDATQESATKVRPEENSLEPSPNLILGSVKPWDLWMVTARSKRKGNCVRTIGRNSDSKAVFEGAIAMTGTPSGKSCRGSVRPWSQPFVILARYQNGNGKI
jgi:hypothetical protein